MVKICKHCGKEFEASVSNQMFCTVKCRRMDRSNKSYTKIKCVQQKYDIRGKTLKEWSSIAGEFGQKILSEYSDKNIVPADVIPAGSGKKVHWKCSKCGYEWDSIMRNRTRDWKGCPSCAGLVIDSNNLYKWCLEHGERGQLLLNEYSLKNEVDIRKIAPKSGSKVYWECSICHHEWETTVGSRTGLGSNCPRCNKHGTSFGEQIIFYIMTREFPQYNVQNRSKIDNYEIDILVPELNLGIEYSGYIYHKDKYEHDNKKRIALNNIGYNLITILETAPHDELDDSIEYDFAFVRKWKLNIVPMLNFLKQYINNNYSIDINIELTDEELEHCLNKSKLHTEYKGAIDLDTVFVLKALGKKQDSISSIMNCSISGIWSRIQLEGKEESNQRKADIYDIVRMLSIGMSPEEISSLNNTDNTDFELEFETEEKTYDLNLVLKIKDLLEKYSEIQT